MTSHAWILLGVYFLVLLLLVKPLGIYNAMHPTRITNEKVRAYALLDNLWKMMDALGLCVFGFVPRGVMSLDLISPA